MNILWVPLLQQRLFHLRNRISRDKWKFGKIFSIIIYLPTKNVPPQENGEKCDYLNFFNALCGVYTFRFVRWFYVLFPSPLTVFELLSTCCGRARARVCRPRETRMYGAAPQSESDANSRRTYLCTNDKIYEQHVLPYVCILYRGKIIIYLFKAKKKKNNAIFLSILLISARKHHPCSVLAAKNRIECACRTGRYM